MKFQSLHDRVVVRRLEAEEKTAGDIIIPDTAKEKPMEGEVIAVGPGARGPRQGRRHSIHSQRRFDQSKAVRWKVLGRLWRQPPRKLGRNPWKLRRRNPSKLERRNPMKLDRAPRRPQDRDPCSVRATNHGSKSCRASSLKRFNVRAGSPKFAEATYVG